MTEPILSKTDIEAWDMWRRAWDLHARTRSFARALDSAKRVLDEAVQHAPGAVAWSAGKDSTALVHLACVEMGMRDEFEARSEKDDLDYPGEREYVERLGAEWNIRLRIYAPATSPREYIERRAMMMSGADDVHSRRSGLSKTCFYPVTGEMDEGLGLVAMGLRCDESATRRNLRLRKGRLYQIKSGQWRTLPIADWSGNDVFAYMQSRGVEPLPVYKCIGLQHRDAPWLIRKSWWIPGGGGGWHSHGGYAWLRRYYPSLFDQASKWFPDLEQMS